MTDWTTNSKGATLTKPCPTGALGVYLCARDDVNSWGDRLDELEGALRAESISFGQWLASKDKSGTDYKVGQRIVQRYAGWVLDGKNLVRSSVTGINAPSQVRALVDHIHVGAAILESMTKREDVYSTNPVNRMSMWVTLGAVAVGGFVLWSVLK